MGFFDDVGSVVGGALNPFGSAGALLGNADGGNLGADILTQGAYGNAQAVRDTNATNIALSQKQQDFQERMSNTAFQRAISDMHAAGINPLLVSPSGASTPSGSLPSLTPPRPGDIGAGLASSAKDAVTMTSNLQEQKSRTALNEASTVKANADTAVSVQNASNIAADTNLKSAQIQKAGHDTRASKEAADQAHMTTQLKRSRFGVDSSAQKFDAIKSRIPFVDKLMY